MNDEEKITNFCAITNADPDKARQYLAVSDGSLDQAVNFFLETGGAALESSTTATASNNSVVDTLPDDDDAQLAARLQQEENAKRSTSDDNVRAAIAPRTETLVEDFSSYLPPRSRQPRSLPSVFNQGRQGLSNSQDLSAKQSRLEALFRPPFDIISRYDFDTAKEKGREQKRWLLVNVQDVTDFQCQVLNRDFWSNEAVKETVRENFIFLQFNKDEYDGEEFTQFYPITNYPYLGILDPRTSEEMKTWAEIPSPLEWVASVHEFLERYSLDPRSRNPIGKIAKHKSFDHMTEDEQIQFALQQSMGKAEQDSDEDSEMSSVSVGSVYESADEVITKDKGKKRVEVINLDDDDEDEVLHHASEEPISSDPFYNIPANAPPEPASDPKTTTRVQIRLADGTRKIRRFNNADRVQALFEYVKADIPHLATKHFQIISSDRKKLIDFLDSTVEAAGLKNAVVLVEVDDD
ncbi:thioredoxin-like protein, partial [Lipomyces japonicus]|uniref:thioredoxin-like protein n=1 Tax=Lipomyces japonicus TaxID=56871 RepID=UPI0034CDCF3A